MYKATSTPEFVEFNFTDNPAISAWHLKLPLYYPKPNYLEAVANKKAEIENKK